MSAVIERPESTGLVEIVSKKTALEALATTSIKAIVFDACIDAAIEETATIVHPLTEDGYKQAKDYSARAKKIVKAIDDEIMSAFNAETEAAATLKNSRKAKTKQITTNLAATAAQFEKHVSDRLAEVRAKMSSTLAEMYETSGVQDKFKANDSIESLVKMNGMITGGGKPVKSAIDFMSGIVASAKARQETDSFRRMHLDNSCLKAGINPPISPEVMGANFMVSDNEEFERLVHDLVERESKRIAEAESLRQKRQDEEVARQVRAKLQEEEMKREFALRQEEREKAELARLEKSAADKLARDEAEAEAAKKRVASQVEIQRAIREQEQKRFDAKHQSYARIATESKKTVTVTVTFELEVGINVKVDSLRRAFGARLSAVIDPDEYLKAAYKYTQLVDPTVDYNA